MFDLSFQDKNNIVVYPIFSSMGSRMWLAECEEVKLLLRVKENTLCIEVVAAGRKTFTLLHSGRLVAEISRETVNKVFTVKLVVKPPYMPPSPTLVPERKIACSVVIASYNMRDMLQKTLTSLVPQLSQLDEVIVVDDGSDDGTGEMIKTFFPKAKYIKQNREGYRQQRARNIGINKAVNDCVILLDADCIPLPGFVKAHKYFFDPCKVLTGKLYLQDQKGEVRDEGLTLERRNLEESEFNKIRCGNLCFSRSNILEVGGFTEDYDGAWGYDDLDFAYKVVYLLNGEIQLNPDACVVHQHRFAMREAWDTERNMKIFQRKLAEYKQKRLFKEKEKAFLKEAPKVSVVVPVKNRVDRIKKCLDSILAEGYPNLEVIVADGASTDGTLEFLKKYSKIHPEVKYISEADKNQCEARNKGLKLASGKYVTFQDADDEMIPGKISVLSLFLELNDKHFAVFGNTVFRTPDGRVYGNNRNAVPGEISFDTLSKTNYVGSGSIMLRNSPDLHFDEDKRFGEDYWLWMKLAMKYNIGYLDKDVYYWTTGSPDGVCTNTPNWQETDKNRKEEARKVYSRSPYKEKMRIAVFCDAFGVHPFGGPAVYGYNLCEMLYKSRMFYMIFCNPNKSYGPHPDYCRRPEVVAPRTDNINVDDFNVFYVMSSPSAIGTLNAKGILPIIGSNHIPNSAPEHCLKYLNAQELAIRESMVASERMFLKNHRGKFWFAQSVFQKREYERLGLNTKEIGVYLAPNPIDTDLFCNAEHKFGNAVMWSGKFGWAKGVPFLKEVCHKTPETKFTCLSGGEGPEMPSLPKNAELIVGNTLFKVPELLQRGQIFLSTSVTENQPCAVLEAMAMELPVVGFKTSGMPEVVKDGETGFLVELDDVDGMVNRIRQLINDESLRREMGKKAREFMLKNFSYYSTLDIYLKYFKTYLEA